MSTTDPEAIGALGPREQIPFARFSAEDSWFMGTAAFGNYVMTLDILSRPRGYFRHGLYQDPMMGEGLSYEQYFDQARHQLGGSLENVVLFTEALMTQDSDMTGLTLSEALARVVEEAYKDCNDVLFRNEEIAKLRPNPLVDPAFLDLFLKYTRKYPFAASGMLFDQHAAELLAGITVSPHFAPFMPDSARR